MRSHPLVRERSRRVPADSRGEIIKAAVVVTPGAQRNRKEIMAYCKEGLANFKIPKVLGIGMSFPEAARVKSHEKVFDNPSQ